MNEHCSGLVWEQVVPEDNQAADGPIRTDLGHVLRYGMEVLTILIIQEIYQSPYLFSFKYY